MSQLLSCELKVASIMFEFLWMWPFSDNNDSKTRAVSFRNIYKDLYLCKQVASLQTLAAFHWVMAAEIRTSGGGGADRRACWIKQVVQHFMFKEPAFLSLQRLKPLCNRQQSELVHIFYLFFSPLASFHLIRLLALIKITVSREPSPQMKLVHDKGQPGSGFPFLCCTW